MAEYDEKCIPQIKSLIAITGSFYYENLSKEYRNNPEVALAAIKHHPNLVIMEYANEAIRDNKEIALLELKTNGRAIGFLSERLRADKELALIACVDYPNGLRFLSEELRNDEEVVKVAVSNDPYSLFYANESMQFNTSVLDVALAEYKTNKQYYDSISKNNQFFKNYEAKKNLSDKLNSILPNIEPSQTPKRRLKL